MSNAFHHVSNWSLDQDIEFILSSSGDVWSSLRGARIFITGGTGFIGRWLLESLRKADQRLGLGVQATILSRDPQAFRLKLPHLAGYSSFHVIAGDVWNFEPPVGNFSHIVHAATDASAYLNESNPRLMFDTILQGTRRVLDFAVERSAERMLFLSSGAVYGQQPWEMERVREDWLGSPSCTDPRAAYAEGKRAAEIMCAIYNKQYGIEVTIARIFALLGPGLNLDTHFAAGNFIRDAIRGKPVIVDGNGLPCRSYLYTSDLTIWLWHLLVFAKPVRPYNVGSDESISICDLAKRVSRLLAKGKFQVRDESDTGFNLGRYVPETSRIGDELGLYRTVSLNDAILRTAFWNGWNGK